MTRETRHHTTIRLLSEFGLKPACVGALRSSAMASLIDGGCFGRIAPGRRPDVSASCCSCELPTSCDRAEPLLPQHSVPRRRWDDPSVVTFLQQGEPVVLTGGCPLTAGLAHWNLDHLCDAAAVETESANATWPVHFTPRDARSVWRTYGPGVSDGGVCEMTLDSFVAAVTTTHVPGDSIANFYLQALLTWRQRDEREMRPLLGTMLRDELNDGIGWEWLQNACEMAGEGESFEACQLWASGGGLTTPCHYDGASNFICQLQGVKRFVLFSPCQTFCLYPFPVAHPLDNFAMANPKQPDLERHPALAFAQGCSVTLEPGEVLWLPRFWWHHVEQPEVPSPESIAHSMEHLGNVSLNFWLGPSAPRPLEVYEWLSTRAPAGPSRKVEQYWMGGADRLRAVRMEWERLDRALLQDCTQAIQTAKVQPIEQSLESVLAEPGGAIRCLHAARMVEHAAATVSVRARVVSLPPQMACVAARRRWQKCTANSVAPRHLRCSMMSSREAAFSTH